MTTNEKLLDEFVTYTANLRRLSVTESADIVSLLIALQNDLTSIIYDNPAITTYNKKRLEALITQAQDTIDSAYTDITAYSLGFETAVAKNSVAQALGVFNGIGILLDSVAMTEEQYEALASNALINGAPSADWWRKQDINLRDAFAQQIRMGYTSGETIDQIVQRIRGKATGKRISYTMKGETRYANEFIGGIMDISTRQARALVRTSVQQVANDARKALFDNNSDIIKGQMWVSTLDNRTTLLCASRDGLMYTLQGEPIGHSMSFLTGPPAHYNCRSTLVPILKSWEDITGDPELDKWYAKIEEGTRASMDGQVPESKKFEEWFSGKSEDFQKDYLGAGKWELWNAGKISIPNMISADGTPLTLQQLNQLYGV